jgi:hypothetical protein
MWWRVVQKGSEDNDWVLTAAVGDVLRVRHWKGQEQILFFQLFLTHSLSGTCITVK